MANRTISRKKAEQIGEDFKRILEMEIEIQTDPFIIETVAMVLDLKVDTVKDMYEHDWLSTEEIMTMFLDYLDECDEMDELEKDIALDEAKETK